MKKVALLLWVLLFTGKVLTAQSRNILSLVGDWVAMDENNAGGGLEVIDSSKIFLIYGNQKMQVVSYTADFSKSPCWFDFVVKDSTKEINLKSLLQFLNDDTLQWQVFDGDTRPDIFSADKGDMLYLKRKQ